MDNISEAVARNRDAAYKGEIGRRRLQFCHDYTAYKHEALAHGAKLLREGVVAEGKSITCQQGCAFCCNLYVFTTLQEAEGIVYHLYQHEAALEHFVAAYPPWHRGLGLVGSKLPRIDRMIAKNLTTGLSGVEQNQLDADLNEYAGRQVPCPFLVDNCCSVYELRPFACAAVVAVTPPELCAPDASGTNLADYRKIEVKLDQEMPYFIKTRNPIIFGCLPAMANSLLERGYSFLAGIEGLEELDVSR